MILRNKLPQILIAFASHTFTHIPYAICDDVSAWGLEEQILKKFF